jgi:SAM-dependent methyltransferase
MRVGVIGATGAVGKELVEVLAKRHFPVTELRLFASTRSAGTQQSTPWGDVTIEAYSPDGARNLDLALLAVSGEFARAHARALAAEGVAVVDNSSALRLEEDVPLVVPEVNAAAIGQHRLIANPNCTTAILVVALEPLRQAFGLKRAHIDLADITKVELEPCGAVVMNYTLQFLPKAERLPLLKKIYAALRPGGVLILAEKVQADSDELQDLVTDIYYDFKGQNGYSKLEISQKREALENVLIPLKPSEQIETLKKAGFGPVEMLLRWGPFATYLAIKRA